MSEKLKANKEWLISSGGAKGHSEMMEDHKKNPNRRLSTANKVYCGNCIYNRFNQVDHDRSCGYPLLKTDIDTLVGLKNRDNDCLHHKRSWYEFS